MTKPATKKPATPKIVPDPKVSKPVTPKPVSVKKPKPTQTPIPANNIIKYDTARVLKACRDFYKNTIRINEHRINMSSGAARIILVARVNKSLSEISAYYDKLRASCQKARPAKTIIVEEDILVKIIALIENNSASDVELDTSQLNHKSF